MPLSKEIHRDEHFTLTKEYNTNGDLVSEEYKTGTQIRLKKIVYNDKKQISSIIETNKDAGQLQDGQLTLYVYTGNSYRMLVYKHSTTTFADYLSSKPSIYGKENEAHYVRDIKSENGLLLSEHHEDREEGTKYSTTYTYSNGVKSSETKVAADGTTTKIDYTYEGGFPKSKLTVVNNQFSDMFIYTYRHNLLSEEQKLCKHEGMQYPSLQKKYFYNAKQELEKTTYYGRYNGSMNTYKTEEVIRKENILTKKNFEVENAEMALGRYDITTLYNEFKNNNMEWAIPIFDNKYFETHPLQEMSCTIEKYDTQGNIIEMIFMHPFNKDEVMGKVVYRNEYNDKSLLEFVISYRITDDGQKEEMDIKKYYYY
ncbi:hypothetical protein SAMN05428988_4584 [Chitinophaga sp. YR573]|uniref:hypothetical protein n=1 Tax=Chitinophaga sp. YR573 TaxID=1881040 RepID=UPI0008CF7347|nr:hypothetical protein [Chitinophaga sp. YR573]SEW36981.1 hypothetical protein SAMN05428988_4584 [Chitinophaga sp. YR573]